MSKEKHGKFTGGAHLYARRCGTSFFVGPNSTSSDLGNGGWYFTATACFEAAHWFAALAKELKGGKVKRKAPAPAPYDADHEAAMDLEDFI